MRTNKAFQVLKALKTSKPAVVPSYKLATITTIDTQWIPPRVRVTFDGESEEALLDLTWLQDYTPRVSDRILLARVGKTWVILGKPTLEEGVWRPVPSLESPWTAPNIASPAKYLIQNGRLWLQGRLDYGATLAGPATPAVFTIPGITSPYTRTIAVGTYSTETGNNLIGTAMVAARVGTTGAVTLSIATGQTMQRNLVLDQMTWPID